MGFTDSELSLYLLLEHPLWIRHHLRRERHGRLRLHALRLVDQRELVTLDFGHECDLVALHRDLVGIDLLFAFRSEVSTGSHRERVRDQPRHAGDDHCLMLGRRRRADDTSDEPEVRRQPVVEPVHDVPEESARLGLMPWLRALAADSRKLARVLRRLSREQQCLTTTGGTSRCLLMEVEVSLYFATLLSQ